MNNFDFWKFNANLIISASVLLIAASLVYIAFKLSEKNPSKTSKVRS
ncbi:MAG: hypothetical protein ABH814_03110 [bacterium]